MNKKADITVTILVLGIFIVCTLAIFSFISENNKSNQHLASIGFLETMNAIEEEINFNQLPINKEGIKITRDRSEIVGSYYLNKKFIINITYYPKKNIYKQISP